MEIFSDRDYLQILIAAMSLGLVAGIGAVTWQIHKGDYDPRNGGWLIAGAVLGAVAIWFAFGLVIALFDTGLDQFNEPYLPDPAQD